MTAFHTRRDSSVRPKSRADTLSVATSVPGDPAPEIGWVIARVFDMLEGTPLEPFATQVASSVVNRARPVSPA